MGTGRYDGGLQCTPQPLLSNSISSNHPLPPRTRSVPCCAKATAWTGLACSGRWKVPMVQPLLTGTGRSEEHTSELQSLMRISYAVFCLKKKKTKKKQTI